MSQKEPHMDAFVKEQFEKCEAFIAKSTPEELIEYEKSLGIDYKDYSNGISFMEFIDSITERKGEKK